MHWEDTVARHRVTVLDAAVTDGEGFHARLPFEVVRRYVDARSGGRLPDQLLAALEVGCAYCVGVGLASPEPDAPPCAFCRGARVWRLPWRGHASSDGTIQVSSGVHVHGHGRSVSIYASSIFLFSSLECYTRVFMEQYVQETRDSID
jgi:hypothetical protein